jgi:hypothetical protein
MRSSGEPRQRFRNSRGHGTRTARRADPPGSCTRARDNRREIRRTGSRRRLIAELGLRPPQTRMLACGRELARDDSRRGKYHCVRVRRALGPGARKSRRLGSKWRIRQRRCTREFRGHSLRTSEGRRSLRCRHPGLVVQRCNWEVRALRVRRLRWKREQFSDRPCVCRSLRPVRPGRSMLGDRMSRRAALRLHGTLWLCPCRGRLCGSVSRQWQLSGRRDLRVFGSLSWVRRLRERGLLRILLSVRLLRLTHLRRERGAALLVAAARVGQNGSSTRSCAGGSRTTSSPGSSARPSASGTTCRPKHSSTM